MVEPVVVNPEIVSNNASGIEGISLFKRKGSAPKILSTTQQRETVTNPSLP